MANSNEPDSNAPRTPSAPAAAKRLRPSLLIQVAVALVAAGFASLPMAQRSTLAKPTRIIA